MYTYEEAYKSTLEYFKGDELATEVFLDKYALKNKNLELLELNPDMTHRRLAKEIARIEKKYPNPITEEEVYQLLKDFRYFVFGGSPTYGMGNDFSLSSLANCFFIGNEADSYGGILTDDQELVQLMKRRGGCIEENTSVIIKNKGIIPIKDVKIGDEILSFNIITKQDEWKLVKDWYYTDVDLEDQIEINTKRGIKLKTSKKHPLLIVSDNNYKFKSYNDCQYNNLFGKTLSLYDLKSENKSIDDIGWWIGCHMGDGTATKIGYKNRKNGNKTESLLILGDNENVIKKYKKIHSQLSGSDCAILKEGGDGKSRFKSIVWSYRSSCNANKNIIDTYFDGQIGSKTYTWKVPSYILDNDLWIPFLAGLIDSDGFVRSSGAIDIDTCSIFATKQICEFLSSKGQSFALYEKQPIKKNENIQYRIMIHKENSICDLLISHLAHELKKEKIITKSSNLQSFKFKLLKEELDYLENLNLKNIKFSNKKEYSLLITNLYNLRKDSMCGVSMLNLLLKLNIFSKEKVCEIKSRIEIERVIIDNKSKFNYIDIEVEGNNNYYAGEFGFMNIHNCGLDLSHLRPEGTMTSNSAGRSSGAVSFASRYSNSTREVAQGGGRRGALMLSMHIKHPDANKFIECKSDKTKVTGANISVKVDKEFMEAVKNNSDYIQTFPIDLNLTSFLERAKPLTFEKLIQYNELKQVEGGFIKRIKARELWNKIVQHNIKDAEPGVLFWDTILEESPSDCYMKTMGVNPCAEIPLSPYDSCRLASLNLYSYVENPFTEKAKFNWELFEKHCRLGQRIIDDLIDLEEEKINTIIKKVERDNQSSYIKHIELVLWQRIKTTLLEGRRCGFGVTGEGDMLAALGIKYGTQEAVKFCEEVHETMAREVYISSIYLAKERGAFPIWDYEKEKDNPFLSRIYDNIVLDYNLNNNTDFDYEENPILKQYLETGRRNISLLTIAPNGTLSLMTQTTSGMEPCFEVVYKRRRKVFYETNIKDQVGDYWEEYKVFHPKFVEWCRINKGESFTALNLDNLTIEELNCLIKESPYYKAIANEIDYLKKIEMQGKIQKWIDHSISVTHNLPKGITEEKVSDIYLKAYEVGCKGCTIYVDGSRSGVLIKEEKPAETKSYERPESLPCDIYVVKVKGNEWVVLVGLDYRNNNRPYEIFAFKQKNLQITQDLPNAKLIKRKEKDRNYYDLIANSHFRLNDIASFFELGEEQSLTRQISLNLRYGIIPVVEVIDQLEKAVGSVVELSKAILRVLKKYVKDEDLHTTGECPNCHSTNLIPESGCLKCKDCGWSKC